MERNSKSTITNELMCDLCEQTWTMAMARKQTALKQRRQVRDKEKRTKTQKISAFIGSNGQRNEEYK